MALEALTTEELDELIEEGKSLLEKWRSEGYVVVPESFPPSVVKAAREQDPEKFAEEIAGSLPDWLNPNQAVAVIYALYRGCLESWS